MKKCLFPVLAMLLCCGGLFAQDYALEVTNDSKFINVKKLGLPPSTTVQQVLSMLPEVLSRPGTYVAATNYTILINGSSVGNLSDEVLIQLRIVDVAKIMISESATASFTNQGEGGTINIILAEKEDKVSGNVSLDMSQPTSVAPGLHINSKQKGWDVTGIFKSNYYNPGATTYNVSQFSKDTPIYTYEKDTKFAGQIGRVYANYKGEKDQINITLGESSSDTKITTDGAINDTENLSLMGHISYGHSFSNVRTLKLDGEYSYSPNDVNDFVTKTNNLSLQARYIEKINKNLTLTGGVTYNSSWRSNSASDEESVFIMPYMKAEASVGKWKLLAEIDYQYFGYDVKEKSSLSLVSDYDPAHNLTGIASACWQFHPHRMLRLMADRKIQRQNHYTLEPIKLDEISLDYIRDIQNDDNMWIFNFGGGYIHVSDVFPADTKPYTSSNIWNLDAMTTYQRGILTLSLTANLYNSNRKYENSKSDECIYYNITMMPSLTFSNQMYCALNIIYNSPVEHLYSKQGRCCYARTIVGKNWGHWNLHAYGQLNLGGRTTDMNYYLLGGKYVTYDLVRNIVGAGVRYNF